jgi:hypothetical protein
MMPLNIVIYSFFMILADVVEREDKTYRSQYIILNQEKAGLSAPIIFYISMLR